MNWYNETPQDEIDTDNGMLDLYEAELIEEQANEAAAMDSFRRCSDCGHALIIRPTDTICPYCEQAYADDALAADSHQHRQQQQQNEARCLE